jgi:hypothetical protein
MNCETKQLCFTKKLNNSDLIIYSVIGDYCNSNSYSNNRARDFGYRMDKFFFCYDERGRQSNRNSCNQKYYRYCPGRVE